MENQNNISITITNNGKEVKDVSKLNLATTIPMDRLICTDSKISTIINIPTNEMKWENIDVK